MNLILRSLLYGFGAVGATTLLIGLPTDLVPNPWFARMMEARPQDYAFLAVTAMLAGLLAATYAFPAACPRYRGRFAAGGLLTVLAVGCPICNKLVVLALGAGGAMTWFEPLQPLLALLSIALLTAALFVRVQSVAAAAEIGSSPRMEAGGVAEGEGSPAGEGAESRHAHRSGLGARTTRCSSLGGKLEDRVPPGEASCMAPAPPPGRESMREEHSGMGRPLRSVRFLLLLIASMLLMIGTPDGYALAQSSAAEPWSERTDDGFLGTPTRPASDDGRHIRISVEERRLHVMEGDRILWSAVVGVGTGDTLTIPDNHWEFFTPPGSYQVQRKERDPVWLLPDWVFVRRGEPIPPRDSPLRREEGMLGAAALYLTPEIAIHGTDELEGLGHAVSHGCIRMADDDIIRLYEEIEVGAPVVVY